MLAARKEELPLELPITGCIKDSSVAIYSELRTRGLKTRSGTGSRLRHSDNVNPYFHVASVLSNVILTKSNIGSTAW